MNHYSSLPISVNEEDSLLGAFAVADPDIISDEMVYGTSGYVIRVRLVPAYNKNIRYVSFTRKRRNGILVFRSCLDSEAVFRDEGNNRSGG